MMSQFLRLHVFLASIVESQITIVLGVIISQNFKSIHLKLHLLL